MIRIIALVAALVAGAAKAEVEIQEVTSPGGITAWLVEEHSIPFTALELRFQGGASLDAADKRGAVNMMTGLLEEGAGEMDAQAFQTAREELAASYSFAAYDDSIAIGARFLTENRAAAVDLLKLAIAEPRFDPVAIDRVRAQVIAGIRSDLKDPDEIAGEAFNRAAFGDHPYGSPESGTIETVGALSRDDLVAAHGATLARGRLFVGAVGDITPEALGLLLDDLLGDLPETGAAMPETVEFGLPGGVTVIDYATPQSVALFGHEGTERDDDDFFAAYVLNVVLGAPNFESRLMEEVREKRGLTYGVYTYLVPKDHVAMILGSVASANDRIGEAITVIRDEWRRIAEGGVTQDELDTAKTYLTGAYPLRFDGNGPIADILVGMQMQGLPVDYIPTRNDKVNAVTLADVNRVAAELLDPEALHFTVVGQPEGLDAAN